MAYRLVRLLTTVNRTKGGNKKKYIVIHYTGNKTDTAKANANYFRSENRGASAHYFVDKTTVYQVVEDDDQAWAVGRNYGSNNLFGKVTNANSISIEMCSTNGKVADETFENTVKLTKSLMKKYGIPASNVIRHWDVCSKVCPGWNGWGTGGKDASIWNKFKKEIVAPEIKQIPGKAKNDNQLYYRAHCQNLGWLDTVHDGQTAGTTGFSTRLEALLIDLRTIREKYPDAKLSGDFHIQDIGWGHIDDIEHDTILGTIGKALRLEAFKLHLEGVPDKKLYYEAHVQDIGWQGVRSDGEVAGTTGQSKRIEAVRIWLE